MLIYLARINSPIIYYILYSEILTKTKIKITTKIEETIKNKEIKLS